MMKLLPLVHRLHGRRCLLAGGGPVALRRAQLLHAAGAQITLIAIDMHPALKTWLDGRERVTAYLRAYQPSDLTADYYLAIAATDDRAVNRHIADAAARLGVSVNVTDDAARCDVMFPALIDRDPVLIAVSSSSASPVLTRWLVQRIDALLPRGVRQLAELVGRFRAAAHSAIPDARTRAQFWQRILQGAVAESVFSGKMDEAEALLVRALEKPQTPPRGAVYLIGAGPGDPDLLTLRALRLLQQADVVIHDRLVSPEILALADPQAELIHVGKQRARHTMPQADINQLLARLARQGRRVARLKGGDPFIFGRGGEEIEALAAEQVPFQVIPGITAANGCSSYAGIPLTHRECAQSVCFVTAQTKGARLELNWANLARRDQTAVFYMGLRNAREICRQLIQHGLPQDWPAGIIENGTTPQQRVFAADLQSLPDIAQREGVQSPALLIVGKVVALHAKLAWN